MEEDPTSVSANVRRARFARSQHSSRQHEAAHAEDTATPPPPLHVPDRPLIPRNEADLVTTQAELLELLDRLRAAGSFAYDSEFIGELTYVPKLCLVQVATAERVSLIDPLEGLDLKPFWELVADPSVEKITHAGQQDVEPVVRHLGTEAKNVFDTQIACGFIGMAYPVALA
jgi:ribonuclease D